MHFRARERSLLTMGRSTEWITSTTRTGESQRSARAVSYRQQRLSGVPDGTVCVANSLTTRDLLPFSARIPRTGTTGTFPRTYSLKPSVSRTQDARLSGFGGFPTPFQLAKGLVQRVAPKASLSFGKTATMPRTNTISGRGTMATDGTQGKEVPYISFSAVVGRNSRFTDLTDEQKDELGGVEYRALRVLLYIVVGVSPLSKLVVIADSYSTSFSCKSRHSSSWRRTSEQADGIVRCLTVNREW